MTKNDYKSVSLPVELYDEIVKIIENRGELGYASISEFVKDSVRSKLQGYAVQTSSK